MRNPMLTLLLVGMSLLPTTSWSQPRACAALEGKKRQLADQLLASQRPYDCCKESIAKCLRKKRVCRLARRLAQNICRRVAQGQSRERIGQALARRGRAMKPGGKKATFQLTGFPSVGEPSAPITVVEYACARCPFCGLMTPRLYDAVSQGTLKGGVRLVFKPFPIRSHAFSKEANLGLMAAARAGRFWPFMKQLYANFDGFSNEAQLKWAADVGLPRDAFAKQLADPATRKALIASKKEGLRNKVDATPALFINGQRYTGEHGIEEVLDVLEEHVERARGLRHGDG